MSEHPTLVVTAFGAFGSVEKNPSIEVAEHLVTAGLADLCLVLPTSFARSQLQIELLLERLKPRFLLMLGFSRLAIDSPKLETLARLLAKSTVADVDGECAVPASEQKLSVLTSRIAQRLAQDPVCANVGLSISTSAGGYVCEYAYYSALDAVGRTGMHSSVLFIHINAASQAPTVAAVARWMRNQPSPTQDD